MIRDFYKFMALKENFEIYQGVQVVKFGQDERNVMMEMTMMGMDEVIGER